MPKYFDYQKKLEYQYPNAERTKIVSIAPYFDGYLVTTSTESFDTIIRKLIRRAK